MGIPTRRTQENTEKNLKTKRSGNGLGVTRGNKMATATIKRRSRGPRCNPNFKNKVSGSPAYSESANDCAGVGDAKAGNDTPKNAKYERYRENRWSWAAPFLRNSLPPEIQKWGMFHSESAENSLFRAIFITSNSGSTKSRRLKNAPIILSMDGPARIFGRLGRYAENIYYWGTSMLTV